MASIILFFFGIFFNSIKFMFVCSTEYTPVNGHINADSVIRVSKQSVVVWTIWRRTTPTLWSRYGWSYPINVLWWFMKWNQSKNAFFFLSISSVRSVTNPLNQIGFCAAICDFIPKNRFHARCAWRNSIDNIISSLTWKCIRNIIFTIPSNEQHKNPGLIQ